MNCTENTALAVATADESALHCPYSDVSEVCNASLSSLLPSPAVKVGFCHSEDYDNCPLFLAKVLRGRRK